MYDILVLGAGISGLSAALHAAEKGLSVVILTKGAKPDGSSNYAQGGIATVTEKTDKSISRIPWKRVPVSAKKNP